MVAIGALYMSRSPFNPGTFAAAAERAGFDSVWAGDHLLPYIDGLSAHAYMAGRTESITIGTNVIILPLRPAAITAKALLTTAHLAQRPTIAGVGVGGEVPKEFEAAGADLTTRGAYSDEALRVIHELWQNERASFHGRWSNFDDVTMEPRVPPDRLPQIWIGGNSDAALRRAVRYARGSNPYLVSPEELTSVIARIRVLAGEERRGLEDFTFACTTFYMPGKSVDDALDRGFSKVSFKNVTPEKIKGAYLLGTPEQAATRLRRYVDAGAQHIVVGCAPGADDQLGTYLAAAPDLVAAAAL